MIESFSKKRRTRWIILLGTLILIVAALLLLTGRRPRINISRELEIFCDAPGQVARFKGVNWIMTVVSNGNPIGSIVMRGSPQESPVAFLPGKTSNELYCLYLWDTHMEVISFDLANIQITPKTATPLSWIIVSNTWECRRIMAISTFEALAETLKKMDEQEFKQKSLPAIGLGPFQFYSSRAEVIRQLEKRADPNYHLQ
jgi:hypothetical protein